MNAAELVVSMLAPLGVALDDDQLATIVHGGLPVVVPGGCDACDARQRVRVVGDVEVVVTVEHDDGCPVLARRQARRLNREQRRAAARRRR